MTVRGYRGAEERGVTFHPIFVRNYAREQGKLDRLRRLTEQGRVSLAWPAPSRRKRQRRPIACSKQAAYAVVS